MSTKRLLASLLALLMLFSLLPAAALAEEPEALPPRDESQDNLYDGFYLIGSITDWQPRDAYRMLWNSYDESYGVEYALTCTLNVGDELKVVNVEGGAIKTWYPDPGDNYVVDAAHAGEKIVYFRMQYQSDWAAFGGYIMIDDPPPPQQYHVSTYVNSTVHGTLSVSPEDAYEGDIVTITATPDEGYFLQYIEANSISKVDDTTFTFVMPGYDTTVYATFKIAPGYYFDNTNRIIPDYYVPEEAFSPSDSPFGEWERETTLTEGNYLDVYAVYAPVYAGDRTGYSWVSNTMKLTYSSASNRPSVTAEQAGHAMIFLTETEREGYTKAVHTQKTYIDPSFTWDCWIIVKNFHAITVEAAANGSVTADLTEAYEGQTVQLAATPAEGYRLDSFIVLDAEGVEVPVEDGCFAMPDAHVTVTASFVSEAAATFTVTVDPNIENGTVVADKDSAAEGETVNLTVTPAEGYELETLAVTDADNNPVELNGSSFVMPASSVTVTATFVLLPPPTFTITVAANIENGTVTADKETALEGETVILTVTPDPGYELGSLSVTDANGSPVELDGTSFVMPAASVTVTASFVARMYTITVVGSAEGCTVVADKQTAQVTETVTITVTNDNDHRLHSITAEDADGNPVLLTKIQYSNTKYTFEMPAADVTVTAVTKAVYDLRVGATQVDSLNMADVLGDGTVSYDPASHTLTMTSPTPAYLEQYSTGWVSSGMPELIINAPNGLSFSDPVGSISYAVSTYNNGDLIINGDVALDMPYSNGIYSLGALTVNGNITGSVNAFILFGNTSVTVNGNVNAANNDYIRAVYCAVGDIEINGDFTGNGNGIDANAGSISVTGSVSIATSTTADNYGLKAAGSISVGGSFSFTGKAAYAAYAGQNFSCGGDVTVVNTQAQGICANAGTITVVGGTWDVQARSNPLKAAVGITIPATHAITAPAGGAVTQLNDFYVVTEADGETPATRVVIEEASAEAITVTFDAGEGSVDPPSVLVIPGEAIGELPVPVREGWKFLGWFEAPAETLLAAGQGTAVTAESVFNEDSIIYAHWRLPGDINGDGTVSNKDVTRLQRWLKYHNVDVVEFNLDVNGDGSVSNKDLTRLQRYLKYHDVEIF